MLGQVCFHLGLQQLLRLLDENLLVAAQCVVAFLPRFGNKFDIGDIGVSFGCLHNPRLPWCICQQSPAQAAKLQWALILAKNRRGQCLQACGQTLQGLLNLSLLLSCFDNVYSQIEERPHKGMLQEEAFNRSSIHQGAISLAVGSWFFANLNSLGSCSKIVPTQNVLGQRATIQQRLCQETPHWRLAMGHHCITQIDDLSHIGSDLASGQSIDILLL